MPTWSGTKKVPSLHKAYPLAHFAPPDKADDNWSEAACFLGQSYESATKYQLPQLAWTFTSQQHIYEICRNLE